MQDINFAIIGFGGIAKTHAIGSYYANIMFDLPFNLNLTYAVTRKPIKYNILGSKNTISLEVLNNPNIHFVDVCTPNNSNRDIVLSALKSNKAIYCEKPLAENYKSALEISRAIDENKTKNAVALMLQIYACHKTY